MVQNEYGIRKIYGYVLKKTFMGKEYRITVYNGKTTKTAIQNEVIQSSFGIKKSIKMCKKI